ncbi:SGNH/GDSL hydrolase family protein [Bacillus sp. DTU_2020_1000418_1_SI_GHA_SEK_038]|uniref:SGNH/GDSL hydrolase family protein n=1 Tax=Bacillus sp. DTU_2020_1000418_1_SI_GHA_SEK_038 TaxID=3077585 RepID=UPI0028E8D6DB|nr:SGNH/GDSL hydrolase family protein [Bacillus sp. DTU_2020_1000418_1_SI_GHA_SEK_038]WNS73902.1 SGNH/GDSL hydrolase family protein [Bacillus sp. DTU_2020_1000418_1_SI_GHA_SEK_038]
MKIKFLFFIVSILILASCNILSSSEVGKLNKSKQTVLTAKNMPEDDFIPHDITIVSAGDSLTEGVGDSTNRGGYIPYLKEKLENDKGIADAYFYNFGVKGNRSDQLLKRLDSSKIKSAIGEADIVIVTIGGNDMMKVVRENFTSLNLKAFQKQKQIFKDNLDDSLVKIREDNPNSLVVLVGLYNPFISWFANINEINVIVDEWNSTSKEILEKYPNTFFVEIDDIFQKNAEDLLFTDFFHPNDKGYELIAGRVYDTLKEEALTKLSERFYTVGIGEN